MSAETPKAPPKPEPPKCCVCGFPASRVYGSARAPLCTRRACVEEYYGEDFRDH